VDQDESQTGVADLPMKVDQRVGAEWLRDGLDPGDQGKFDPHQSEADEAESDGEVGPETLPRPIRAYQCEGQRCHADPDQFPSQAIPRTTALMAP
jgi:hypothetical protein